MAHIGSEEHCQHKRFGWLSHLSYNETATGVPMTAAASIDTGEGRLLLFKLRLAFDTDVYLLLHFPISMPTTSLNRSCCQSLCIENTHLKAYSLFGAGLSIPHF